MSNGDPDTLLGGLFQLIVGLGTIAGGLILMCGSLILFVALLGAVFSITFGTAPEILKPLGGGLTEFVVSLLEFFVTVMIVVGAIVMAWLAMSGRIDEMTDEMMDGTFPEQGSTNSNQHSGKDGRDSNRSNTKRRQKSTTNRTSISDNSGSSGTTDSPDDTQFDEYGQIREK